MRIYDYSTQVKIVCATMTIYNFIIRTSISNSDFFPDEQEGGASNDGSDEGDEEFLGTLLSTFSSDTKCLSDFYKGSNHLLITRSLVYIV